MADVLGSGMIALDELRRLVRREIRDEDTSSSGKRWSDDEVDSAIRHAIAQSSGIFYQTGRYTLSFTNGTKEYILPDYIQNVRLVRKEKAPWPSTVVSSNQWETLDSWRHYKMEKGNNLLVYTKDHESSNHQIYYDRDVSIPTASFTLNGAATNVATTFTVNQGGSDPWIYEAELPMYLKCALTAGGYEIAEATAVASATSFTVARAKLGTVAGAITDATVIYPIIMVDDDRFYTYVTIVSAAWLSRSVLHDTSRGADVAGTLTALRSYELQVAKLEKDIKPQRIPVRIKFERFRK